MSEFVADPLVELLQMWAVILNESAIDVSDALDEAIRVQRSVGLQRRFAREAAAGIAEIPTTTSSGGDKVARNGGGS